MSSWPASIMAPSPRPSTKQQPTLLPVVITISSRLAPAGKTATAVRDSSSSKRLTGLGNTTTQHSSRSRRLHMMHALHLIHCSSERQQHASLCPTCWEPDVVDDWEGAAGSSKCLKHSATGMNPANTILQNTNQLTHMRQAASGTVPRLGLQLKWIQYAACSKDALPQEGTVHTCSSWVHNPPSCKGCCVITLGRVRMNGTVLHH